MKLAFLLFFALTASCNQGSQEFGYKATGNETNAALFFDGVKFQLSFNNSKIDVVPEIEQLASAKSFTAALLDTNQPLELSDSQAKPTFKINITTESLSCSADQAEISAELPMKCLEKVGSPTSDNSNSTPPGSNSVATATHGSDQLVTTQQTYFKTSTGFSGDLSADQKCSIPANTRVVGKIVATQASHYKFVLSEAIPSCSIGKEGSTIYIFTGHVSN